MANLDVPHQSLDLLSLPPELIEAISEHLDVGSIKEFRLTCKTLGEQLASVILRAVSIEINRNNYQEGLAKLTVLSKAEHAACASTRKLSIRSLAPSFDPDHKPGWTYVDDEWREGPTPEDPPETIIAKEEVEKCVFDAIASFKGVQGVTWNPCKKDNESLQQAVFDALKTLPNLRRLHINLYNCNIPVERLELEAFESLQRISLTEASTHYRLHIPDSLAKLIAKNPGINSINILNRSGGLDGSPNLHQLFKYYPTHAPPLRLLHLGLRCWSMRLDEITLPHLKYLTSLKFISTLGSNLEEIWRTLHTSRIHLEVIDLDVVTSSFIDYLSSYTGLRKLRLSPAIVFRDKAESDEMAKRFFGEAYTNHVHSLEEIYITPRYEGLWCFGPHNMELISRSTKLRKMRLAILSSQLESSTSPNTLKNVIDMAVTFMPHIEKIDLSGASLQDFPNSHFANPVFRHFTRIQKMLEGCIMDYRAPLSCRRLPILRIISLKECKTFAGNCSLPGPSCHELSEVDETLRYIFTITQSIAQARVQSPYY